LIKQGPGAGIEPGFPQQKKNRNDFKKKIKKLLPVTDFFYVWTLNQNNMSQTPPKTWLLESILVTLFCCLPFGIAGIVNASKVESRFYSGDTEGAARAAADAARWTKIGFWIGLAVAILYLLYIVFVVGMFASSMSSY